MARAIIARGLLGLGILHGGLSVAIAIRGEDHFLVLLEQRLFTLDLMTQSWVLLRALEWILRLEVTVQRVVEVLHVGHDI